MYLFQRTVASPVTCTGVGVHSGKPVTLVVKPAPPNHGIKFVRTDLRDAPRIPALFRMVTDTSLATVLGSNGAIVSTVEHLMACFSGMAVDNALVEVDAYELPIMDGSAFPFADAVSRVGCVEQEARRCFFIIKKPLEIEEDDRSVSIYPASGYTISATIEYDHPLIGTQSRTVEVNTETFMNDISKARTFGFYHEYEYLKQHGLARGGSLDNTVVLDGSSILNEGGLRFDDEFVRHKILDCIGDFSLLGMPLLGRIVACKSGHLFNHRLLEALFANKECWETGFPELPQPAAKALAF
ncbi:UDP-3-O-acyl-N-acetylglucosamine deacetylase [Desulfosudis oleivorans]|uniref:UDP-3-O-acyl-N-acetylglucosamine deacetylase n=1 Tax=Desulfosudis oleivorans (strain DSM 6200 / JCM 39069 / Hxd3) TaxID=96561 RepID=A8ZXG0_DESOH|nr:UDP-3-O-acyl-N-acetylglucosamine deacetylase [Desulfosudis oleivorans]ABW68539.1 UDP-3-0-acyl N-acetylglucosamine deacetylase [Desulfosudis oleivorans Hxd3]